MNKQVEIYDQYSNIYADAENSNELVYLNLGYHETLDTDRYTLVHQSSGSVTTEATDLTDSEALTVVENLYNVSKATGVSYTDKIIKLNEGYAELIINFADGRRLNRVIYTKQA